MGQSHTLKLFIRAKANITVGQRDLEKHALDRTGLVVMKENPGFSCKASLSGVC